MTKETKIGLLVGLAFIILFAIILSEKGTPRRSTAAPSFTLADADAGTDLQTGSNRPLGDAGRLPVDSQLPPIITPTVQGPSSPVMTEEKLTQAPPVRDEEIPPLPPDVVKLLNGEGADSQTEPHAKLSANPVGAADHPPSTATTDNPSVGTQLAKTDPGAAAIPHPGEAADSPDGSMASRGADAAQAAVGSDHPHRTPNVTIRTIHVVERGESLGKIAAAHFGRSTPERVKALFEANRDRLKTPDEVRAGQKLRIPDLGPASDQFEPVRSLTLASPETVSAAAPSAPMRADGQQIRIPIPVGAEAGATKSAKPGAATVGHDTAQGTKPDASPAFRWYEVQPKDTLSAIARRQLGNERLYSEIYRLNRDLIPDQNRIRPGMKIRLPRTPRSAATTAETLTAMNGDSVD